MTDAQTAAALALTQGLPRVPDLGADAQPLVAQAMTLLLKAALRFPRAASSVRMSEALTDEEAKRLAEGIVHITPAKLPGIVVDPGLPAMTGAEIAQSVNATRTATEVALILLGLGESQRTPVANMLRQLPELVTLAQDAHHHERLRQWVDAVAPIVEPAPLEQRAVLSSRKAIQSFIDRFHTTFLTSKEVSERAHLTGRNSAAVPSKWTSEGKVFRLNYAGQYVYPGFQFDEAGNPRPIIKDILKCLRRVTKRDDWGIAVWFGASNGWLGGRAPALCLADEAPQVLVAAEQDALHHEH